MQPEMLIKFEEGKCESFVNVMGGYLDEVAKLPLNYESPPVFSFLFFLKAKSLVKLPIYQLHKECVRFRYRSIKIILNH